MIQHWRLSNFKAAHEALLDFAPLTIFTGTNSAGKSTIIQSILMTVQTLQNPALEPPILLNGPLVKLGEFRDVVFRASVRREEQDGEPKDHDTVTIGFRLTTNPHSGRSLEHEFKRSLERTGEYEGTVIGYEAAAVECAYTFSAIADENVGKAIRLYPLLQSSSARLLFKKVGEWDDYVPPSTERQTLRPDRQAYQPISFELTDSLLSQESSSVDVIRVDPQENLERHLPPGFPRRDLKPSEQSALQYFMMNDDNRDIFGKKTFGVILSHFIPKGVYDCLDINAESIDWFLMMFPHGGKAILEDDVPKGPYPLAWKRRNKEETTRYWFYNWLSDPDLRTLIISIFKEMIDMCSSGKYNRMRFLNSKPSLAVIKSRMATIREAVERFENEFNTETLSDLLILTYRLGADGLLMDQMDLHEDVLRQVLTRAHPPAYRIEDMPINRDLLQGIDFMERFFTTQVKYLGPLREEPKPLYPISEGGAVQDVGLKGQHTAFVYHWHSDQEITYIQSIELEDPYGQTARSNTSLSIAVTDWLNYLGVADNLKPEDRGKLGFEMQVAPDENGSFFDLTQVGTGISQVLPILVMCLLAPSGTTLIIEQPELHLHPRVQTRLADFFASMVWLGKQCIIETHSEHLINRLRYRVAVSEDEKISDDVLLYFVEKEDGQAEYRPIRINKYGVIEEWPVGFFDESHGLAADILRAGMVKRRREGDKE